MKPQPGEEKAEVVACGGENGVDGVALLMGEDVSAHAALVLDVIDAWPAAGFTDGCLSHFRSPFKLNRA